MILAHNLPRIIATARESQRVLDVGGWWRPLTCATHVIDVMPYDTRRSFDALHLDEPERFSADTWTVHDVCKVPWAYPDKHFDFAFCSHLLEDVRDPIAVCGELVRVAKAGYIETPSRTREIFCKEHFFALKAARGRIPEIGFRHHRWFVEIDGNRISFRAKDQRLLENRRHYITRRDLGRKMTEQESGTALWWKDSFSYGEVIDHEHDLARYREEALKRLRGSRVRTQQS